MYWHATGAGEVNIKVGYQSVGLDEAVTAQKMMVLNDVVEREDSLLTFNVDNLYAPSRKCRRQEVRWGWCWVWRLP